MKIKNLIGGLNDITKATTRNSSKMSLGTKAFLVIMSIIIVIIVLILVFQKKIKMWAKRKKENFSNIRCSDSLTFLFPGIFGPPGMTYSKNKAFCEATVINNAHYKNISPVLDIIEIQHRTMQNFLGYINDTKKFFYHIRNGIEIEARDLYFKLYNTYKRLAFVFKVFWRIFYRIFYIMKDIFEIFKYLSWSLQSFWNGVIGSTLRNIGGLTCCFGEETLVNINRNGKILIVKFNEIRIGDILSRNNKNDIVIGVGKFINDEDIYNLNDINVSGSHFVEYNGRLINVKDHPESKLINYERKYIYNLITDSGRFKIGDNIFSDYQVDNSLKVYLNIVKTVMGINIFKDNKFFDIDLSKYTKNALNLYPGFTYNSLIPTQRGIIKAEELDVEDYINGKKILGVVKYKLEGKVFVKKYKDQSIYGRMVGVQLFHKDGKYFVNEQKERWILGKLNCVGIIIDESLVNIAGMNVAHFEIVNDEFRKKIESEFII